MGQELERRATAQPARQVNPSWPTVMGNTVRLWVERHRRRQAARRRLVLLLGALVAMALGAAVTLAFTQRDHAQTASRLTGSGQPSDALQTAATDRHQAAAW